MLNYKNARITPTLERPVFILLFVQTRLFAPALLNWEFPFECLQRTHVEKLYNCIIPFLQMLQTYTNIHTITWVSADVSVAAGCPLFWLKTGFIASHLL